MKYSFLAVALIISSYLVAAEQKDLRNINQEDLNQRVLTEFHEFIKKHWQKRRAAEKEPKELVNGYWSSEDYFNLLIKHSQIERLKYMKKRDLFIRGYTKDNFLRRD